jgi:hypothetical protein
MAISHSTLLAQRCHRSDDGIAGSLQIAPDGDRIVLGSAGVHAQNQSLFDTPLKDAATDAAPAARAAIQPILPAARKELPVENRTQFIMYVAASGGRMQSGASGTMPRCTAALGRCHADEPIVAPVR